MNNEVEGVFKDIFQNKYWGSGESVSGSGSSLNNTSRLIHELPMLLARYNIRSILDIPCGDFHWMSTTDLSDIDYIGADIVADLVAQNKRYERLGVRFEQMDVITSHLPMVDLIFTRDCLVHLSLDQIKAAIVNFKSSGSKYLMTTTFPGWDVNHDIKPGQWRRINLEMPPFNFPSPKHYLFEHCSEIDNRCRDKSLGLWELESINF